MMDHPVKMTPLIAQTSATSPMVMSARALLCSRNRLDLIAANRTVRANPVHAGNVATFYTTKAGGGRSAGSAGALQAAPDAAHGILPALGTPGQPQQNQNGRGSHTPTLSRHPLSAQGR